MKLTVELTYSDRRRKDVNVDMTMYIDDVTLYCHTPIKETKANAICQVLRGELDGRLEEFEVKRVKKHVQTTVVDLSSIELEEIRTLPAED